MTSICVGAFLCTIVFELNLLLGTKERFYKQLGSTSPALSTFTENLVVIDSYPSIGNLIVQLCFGYGDYVGLASLIIFD